MKSKRFDAEAERQPHHDDHCGFTLMFLVTLSDCPMSEAFMVLFTIFLSGLKHIKDFLLYDTVICLEDVNTRT